MIELILATVAVFTVTGGAFLTLDRQAARHSRQIAELCQRVQAPDTAVATHAIGELPTQPVHLPFEDDEAYLSYAMANGRGQRAVEAGIGQSLDGEFE